MRSMSDLSPSNFSQSPERSVGSPNDSGIATSSSSSQTINKTNTMEQVVCLQTTDIATINELKESRANPPRVLATKSKLEATIEDFDFVETGEPKPKHSRSLQSNPVRSCGANSALNLRDYQLELAELALQGRNVFINAPTGSGKTCVAIHIANEHVRRKRGEEGESQQPKVAFLVTTQNLVDQQKTRFEEFSPLRVLGLVGGEQQIVRQRMPLSYQLEHYDVIVMTAAILFNSIRAQSYADVSGTPAKSNAFDDIDDDKLKSISAFSLIIFDECHHCDKDHVYSRIMREHYLPLKLGVTTTKSARAVQLPQIIGLTASPGTGQAKDIQQTIEHLLSLCARLDTEQFVKVRKACSELQDFKQSPTSAVLHGAARSPDEFAQHLLKLMQHVYNTAQSLVQVHKEGILLSLGNSEVEYRKLRLPSLTVESVGSPIWSTYIGTAETLLSQLQSQLGTVRHDLMICVQILKLHHTAMRLNKIARHADALDYLRSVFNHSTSLLTAWNVSDSFEQKLSDALADDSLSSDCQPAGSVSASAAANENEERSIKQTAVRDFRKVEEQLEQLARAEIESLNNQKSSGVNQKLLTLKLEILKQFKQDENSRVLVFVCERRDGIALYEFCRTDKHLSALNVGRLAGSNAAHDDGGLSLRQQDELLRLFSDGHHRVVISTSVAEEGVDIARCNLVIRYCYVSNEIAMVQSKGRARASKSHYVLIVDNDELEQRELDNKNRDKLMNDAIDQLCQLEETAFIERVRSLQSKEYLAWQQRQREENKPASTSGDTFNIQCKFCSSFITTSNYLAKILNAHVVVMDPAVYDRFYLVDGEQKVFTQCSFTHKLACAEKECLQQIGQICRYKDKDFVVLAISGIILENRQTKVRRSYSQWKKAPVQISSVLMQQVFEFSKLTASSSFKRFAAI